MPTVDDETKRDYFITLLLCYINQALDELTSIDQEKPILEYMQKQTGCKLYDITKYLNRPSIFTYRVLSTSYATLA